MDKEKEIQLNKVLDKVYTIGFGLEPEDDLETYFSEKLMVVGTTVDEKFSNLDGMRTLIANQRKQSQGMDIRFERKEAFRDFRGNENVAIVVEDLVATIKVNDDIIKLDIRTSLVLEYSNDQWKLTHWHASKPEMVQSEKDTFGIEDWKQKTTALEKLVEERTADLVNKNRELEIESSLERVRTVAISMQKADDLLKVSEVMYKELVALGFSEIRNALIQTFEEGENYFLDYDYSDLTGACKSRIALKGHVTVEKFVRDIRESKQPFTELEINSEELVKWKAFRRMNNEADDPRLDNISALYYYCYAVGSGSMGISTFSPISVEKREILKRFRNVFDFAYRRYIDVAKAEAQAKEAQTELALERIRAKVTSMRESNDLLDIVVAMRAEFVNLGHEAHYFWHMRWLPDVYEKAMTSGDGSRIGMVMKLPRKIHGDIPLLDQWEKGKEPAVVYTMNVDAALDYVDKMVGMGDFIQIDPNAPGHDAIRAIGGLTFIMARTTHGEIGFSLPGVVPVPDTEAVATLVRFAAVFDLAYRRFEDLKNAEHQFREAQIELALERVRARTMAMQHSEELIETSKLLDQQVRALGIRTWGCAFNIHGEYDSTEWFGSEDGVLQAYKVPRENVFKRYYEAAMSGSELYIEEFSGDACVAHYEYLCTVPVVGDALKQVKASGGSFPSKQVDHAVPFKYGYLLFITLEQVPEAHDIFKRFAKIFEQTYTRFLDLQNAEMQARESQIQLALERVRARTMAMQNSNELPECANLLFQQVQSLGMPAWSAGYCILDPDKKGITLWMSSEGVLQPSFHAPLTHDPAFMKMGERVENSHSFSFFEMGGADLEAHYRYMRTLPVVGEVLDSIIASGHSLPSYQVFHQVGFAQGFLLFITYEQVPHAHDIFKRFGKVFDQTYTRFLDLQKAEAQTRESQIELGLERVRARAMAMQTSDELKGLIGTVFTELTKLDLVLTRCVIMIYNNEANDSRWWMANSEDPDNPNGFYIKAHDHPPIVAYFKGWRNRELKWTYVLEGQVKKDWDVFLFNETELKKLPDFVIEGMKAPDRVYLNASFNNFGNLTLASLEPLNKEQFDILLRFAKVFDLTYTRFNDLQKAESQVREAQIEASLERIRAKAMSMHKSEELDEVLTVLFDQFGALGIDFVSTHMTLIDIPSNTFTFRETGKNGYKSYGEQTVPIDSMEIWQHAAEKWKSSEPLTINYIHFPKESLPQVWQVFHQTFASMPDDAKIYPEDYPDGIHHTAGNCKFGYIGMNQVRKATEEEEQIVVKFATEFGRLYQRFLDLQRAEAQAREAQIEVSLERVRTRAMGMHKSDDLHEAVAVVFEELDKLDLGVLRVGISVLNKEKRCGNVWLTSVDEGKAVQVYGDESFDIHPLLKGSMDAWINRQDFYYVLEGDDLVRYYKAVEEAKFRLPESQMLTKEGEHNRQSCFVAVYNSGGLFAFRDGEFPEEAKQVMRRFASVFDLTYQRFLDLQKAESQAREAMIEASLERVRSKAMAMHSSQDLADTIGVFYKELKSFSITPRRCGVGLLNKESRSGDLFTWNTTETGESLELVGRIVMEGHSVLNGVYENWLTQTEYHPVLVGNEIPEYYKVVIPQMHFPEYSRDVVQYGYFFFFPEGGVYAWTQTQMNEPELEIYRRFTSVLSLTYKRYKDLQQAEALATQAEIDLVQLKEEKKKTEDALAELKNAQKQLIQSEKMASLGELTAGIAHEIQNPLNFVNNFSEVSNELIDEMMEEVAKGNFEEVKAIAEDVKQNLGKINHHGRRADGIVKGMLQHSRSSGSQKEPTNINELADEYLRLAYHGLRAKDKTFNASIHTDFDSSIGKISIIPQDIGRVILNLITNAFYVVGEKKKTAQNGFEAAVSVITKKKENGVEIAVTDNGSGIPEKLLEKIFQPFFTTKPTGQGTGLGLSLSYDIVKAHGGELKVETKEGEGSTFIVQLPLNS